jgi:WS/DGAT/MGAT family acyltransferase
MSSRDLGRRLSAQDAAFLYFEKEEAPLHIGSIAVLEGDVSYERFVDSIEKKLHLIPRYLQRAVPAPFNIGHPTWEWDPEFDIKKHIFEVEVPSPGTDEQLIGFATDLFAGMLDRNKPLWEMYLVKGVEGERSAIVSKVHHCLVDGVSGIELLMLVFDVSPNPPPPMPAPEIERPPIPSPVTRFMDAIFDNVTAQLDQWAEFQTSAADAALLGDSRTRRVLRALETTAPYFRQPVERAPFNKPFKGQRRLAVSEFSFAEIRAIRGICGGTVNDVVLAVLGGALGRYLEMHGQKTEDRMLRVLAPVNVRRDDERGKLGNRVSMLLVEVPLGVQDPVERLHLITERTETLKKQNVADGMEFLTEGINGVPPALQALAGMLPQPPNTVANIVCTNVPGPMIPLYCIGHRMQAHYPLLPLGWEMGIGCGVTSYDQKLYFGLMAAADCAPDVARLKEFLDQAFVELRTGAGVTRSDLPQMGVAPVAESAPKRRSTAVPDASQTIAADAG